MSTPPAPFRTLLPALPVMTLAEPLPVPLILATPSKVRFSTSPSVIVNAVASDCTVSVPPPPPSMTVSVVLSTKKVSSPIATVHRIVADAAVEDVVAVTAVQRVVADATVEDVVVVTAVQRVVVEPAIQRVGPQPTVKRVVAGQAVQRVGEVAAGDDVVEALPVPTNGSASNPGVRQVLHVGDELQRVGDHLGLDLVGTRGRCLDDHIGDVVDDVGVVAGQADHRVGIEAAIEHVVVAGARSAYQQVVAGAAAELVVAGTAEDQVVAAAADDLVVDALLADDEVVSCRSGEIDAAAIPVGRIQPADQVVIRAEQVAREACRR